MAAAINTKLFHRNITINVKAERCNFAGRNTNFIVILVLFCKQVKNY
jgi:hypothetical protein